MNQSNSWLNNNNTDNKDKKAVQKKTEQKRKENVMLIDIFWILGVFLGVCVCVHLALCDNNIENIDAVILLFSWLSTISIGSNIYSFKLN